MFLGRAANKDALTQMRSLFLGPSSGLKTIEEP